MATDDASVMDVAGKISSPGISKMSTSVNEDSAVHPPLVTDSPSVVRQSISPTILMSSTNQSASPKKEDFLFRSALESSNKCQELCDEWLRTQHQSIFTTEHVTLVKESLHEEMNNLQKLCNEFAVNSSIRNCFVEKWTGTNVDTETTDDEKTFRTLSLGKNSMFAVKGTPLDKRKNVTKEERKMVAKMLAQCLVEKNSRGTQAALTLKNSRRKL